MRRQRETPPTLFYRSELVKLATLVLFMGVLIAAISRARDPNTWLWFTGQGDDRSAADSGEPSSAPVGGAGFAIRDSAAVDSISSTDLAQAAAAALATLDASPDSDAAQRQALEYELRAVDDRTELAASEMHAYWRLLAWSAAQTTESLLRRATTGLTFTQIFTEPGRHRGELIRLKIRFRQAFAWDAPETTIDGFAPRTVYDVRGWNDESQPYSFWLICPEKPQGFPLGDRIQVEGHFAGYFLKLVKYEDREGKTRAAPLLIGRIDYTPAGPATAAPSGDFAIWLIGGAVAAFFGLRWIVPRMMPTPRARTARSRPELNSRGEASIPIDDWLERVESEPGSTDASAGAADRRSEFRPLRGGGSGIDSAEGGEG